MSHHTPGPYPEPGRNAYGLDQGSHAAFPPPQPPKPKRKKWPWVVAAIGAVVVISVAANPDSAEEGYNDATGGTSEQAPIPPQAVDERPTPVQAPPAAPAEPEALPDNGVLKVGTDIAPGEYTVTVGDDRFMDTGYWERLSCTTGDFSCILSNEIVQGPGYLTVLPSDVAVKVQNVQLIPAN